MLMIMLYTPFVDSLAPFRRRQVRLLPAGTRGRLHRVLDRASSPLGECRTYVNIVFVYVFARHDLYILLWDMYGLVNSTLDFLDCI